MLPAKKKKADFALLLGGADDEKKHPAEAAAGQDPDDDQDDDLSDFGSDDDAAEGAEPDDEDPDKQPSIDPEQASLAKRLGFHDPDEQQALVDLIKLVSAPDQGGDDSGSGYPPLPGSSPY